MPPILPIAERIDYKIYGVIQQREDELWVKKTEEIKQQLVELWHALIQRVKSAIFVFPVLPGSAESQVIWGGVVKRLLIAYFIGNISAKKLKIRSRVSKL